MNVYYERKAEKKTENRGNTQKAVYMISSKTFEWMDKGREEKGRDREGGSKTGRIEGKEKEEETKSIRSSPSLSFFCSVLDESRKGEGKGRRGKSTQLNTLLN